MVSRDNLTAARRVDESISLQHSVANENANRLIDQSILGDIDQSILGDINHPTLGNDDQSTFGSVDQSTCKPIRGNHNELPCGNDDQPTRSYDDNSARGDDDKPTRDEDDQPIRGHDEIAGVVPASLSLDGMSLKEQSFTNFVVEMEGDDDQSEGEYDDLQELEELPIGEWIAHNSEDIGDRLHDIANAPEGSTEYVLPSTTYSVLFLGETQSGKSTLIESLKQYANPDYIINTRKIGDGSFSLTNDVRIERITSNLPTSYIFNATDKTKEPVDHEKFVEKDQEDYEDELNDRKSYLLATEPSYLSNAYYNLIDTPGLNNTGSNDKSTLEYIFKRIGNISALNLVVVTVSNNPFTQDLKDALKNYFKLLKDFKGHLVFVHTKVDYAKLHREDDQFKQLLEEKNKILHELLGQEAPHIMIDNDLGSKKAVRNCMTQSHLRRLLDMARTNEPVLLPTRYMPPVYGQSYNYSGDSYSPHGGYGHRRRYSRGVEYVCDPQYATIIVYISDLLQANGHSTRWAFHPMMIAIVQREARHHCPQQRQDSGSRLKLTNDDDENGL